MSEKHIVEFSPDDPGYESYVELWTHIYRTGEIPAQLEFDLSEVIGLTGWADPRNFDRPNRFRQYRRFTSAVAIVLIHSGNDSEIVRPANYLARDLVVDCDPDEPEHLLRVRHVLQVTRDLLAASDYENEYPFFTFGSLILAQMANDHVEATWQAARLIDDEFAVRNKDPDNWFCDHSRFLLGLTDYDQLHADWVRLASGLSNPRRDDNIQLIIDAVAKD